MIRQDLLAIGVLLITMSFIILAISVTIWVLNTTHDICRTIPEFCKTIELTSILLLLIMWFPIAVLALSALAFTFRAEGF